jgi:hypothetical protein
MIKREVVEIGTAASMARLGVFPDGYAAVTPRGEPLKIRMATVVVDTREASRVVL